MFSKFEFQKFCFLNLGLQNTVKKCSVDVDLIIWALLVIDLETFKIDQFKKIEFDPSEKNVNGPDFDK